MASYAAMGASSTYSIFIILQTYEGQRKDSKLLRNAKNSNNQFLSFVIVRVFRVSELRIIAENSITINSLNTLRARSESDI